LDGEGKDYAIQKGVKFVKVPKQEEAAVAEKMKPILAEYVKTMNARGLPAEEALNFCLDYIKAHP
jgi:DNA-binding transcriptional regulator YhcF (GntR family)